MRAWIRKGQPRTGRNASAPSTSWMRDPVPSSGSARSRMAVARSEARPRRAACDHCPYEDPHPHGARNADHACGDTSAEMSPSPHGRAAGATATIGGTRSLA